MNGVKIIRIFCSYVDKGSVNRKKNEGKYEEIMIWKGSEWEVEERSESRIWGTLVRMCMRSRVSGK